ncbi:MAG: restriction endonuclease subunit S [Faecalibacterium prausnitzii]|nr:restriction endonuclease subunit S [Faecalibacterium prausnitzii]
MLDNGKAEGARKIKQIEKYCLRDIAIVSQGFTFSRLYQGKKNLKWNYFKVADIGINPNSKYLTNAINTISDITMEEIGALPFPKGSIVFPRVGAALFNNNKKILAQDGVVDDNVLVLTVTDTSKCWYEFLYYYLQGIPLAKWCNSGLVPVINTKTVLSQMVFLPPLPEQQKIAAILSTQDKVIELKEKLLAQKQQQKKYLMQQLLTGKIKLANYPNNWHEIKLGEVSSMASGGTPDSKNKAYYGNTYNWISISDISNAGKYIDDSNRKLSQSGFDNCTARLFNPGTVLLAMYASVGKCAIARKTCCTSQAILGITPQKELVNEYLYYVLVNENVRLKSFSQASSQPNINKKIVEDVLIKLPSLSEQKAIVEILSTADREIDLIQKFIEAEKQKKKALMQLLITGKVRRK